MKNWVIGARAPLFDGSRESMVETEVACRYIQRVYLRAQEFKKLRETKARERHEEDCVFLRGTCKVHFYRASVS